MHKFNDLNQTSVLTTIVAFQLNVDNSLSFGWEIKLILDNSNTITMYYPNNESINIEKYNHDCKYLLSL